MISRRAKTPLSAYQKARLQVVAYRTIQASLTEVLSSHNINISQWVILGWLRDHPDGMRVTALAEVLDVETPLVTTLIGPLQKRELLQAGADSKDKRAKLLTLSDAGEELVAQLEAELTDVMGAERFGMKKNELDAYFSSLERLVTNAHRGSR